MGGWDDHDAGYGDENDDEEAARAAARGVEKMEAWGKSDIPEGEDGESLMRRMARSHAELAIQTLADVARNGVKDAARKSAADSLLNRGFGSVVKKSEQKVDVKVTDQRAAHFAALQALALKNPVLDITDAEFEEIPTSRRVEKRSPENE
jgi:hypothetical protein